MSDPAELEREAEAARARLSDTADQIRARMSPGQMMDEVLNQFRGGDSSQMLANLRDQARDNPMALALVGSGLAWLMMGSGGQTQARTKAAPYSAETGTFGTYRQEDAPYPAAETGTFGTYRQDDAPYSADETGTFGTYRQDDAAGLGSEAERAGRSAAGMAQGALQGASDALSSARTAVGEGLQDASDRAHGLARDLRTAGRDAFGGVRHSATGVSHQARDTFLDVLEREPLVIGAIGVAVGAAIGAFLPTTEVERQHLGPAGEALKEKADALVDRGMAKAKEAAAEIYETARDEADRQGLLPGDKPVAEKIDAVVRAVGETAGGMVERPALEPSSSEADADGTSGGGGQTKLP